MGRQDENRTLSSHVKKIGTSLPRIVCVCDEYFALRIRTRSRKRTE
jgi:hypothetical protein